MGNQAVLLQRSLVILALLGFLAFSAGLYYFTLYMMEDKRSLLILSEKSILWGVWPAFISLFIAIRYKRVIPERYQLISLTPTLELLLLTMAIFFQRWF